MKKKTSEKASLLVEFNACRSSTHGDHSQKTQLRGNKDRMHDYSKRVFEFSINPDLKNKHPTKLAGILHKSYHASNCEGA